ncbi:putative transcription elongation factor SPT5-like protein 1 [Diplonema papillatum]|nr:putative transcription elongation factor SPT5-like protein 1 [Diplonema papillatum]KAJ9444895.1 putative transcription elongation factor SPT5-like protein 1 [Diplonema papillatum]
MAGSDDDSSSLAIPIDQLGDGEGVEDEDDDDSAGVEEGSEDDDDESRGNEADHPKPVRAFSSAIKDLEEKYGKDDDGSDNGVGLDLLDTVSSVPESAVSEFRGYAQQRDNAALGLYPTIADPKLFMMRCKSGFARTLCAQIMYKCLFRASKGDDLMIKSVFCRDHLPEFLYIEAHRQAHVLNVVSGLQGAWRNKIKLIPVSEMPSTLAKTRPAAAVKPGSWGRFRHGLHKGDLCKIMEIDDSKEAYVVHVIPRVDYEKLFDPNSTSTSEAGFRVTKLKARTRPMQRFFTDDYYKKSQLVRRFPDIMTYKENTDEGYIAVAGRRFAFEGHEIKTVRQSAVSTDKKIVNLTTDEHMRFMQGKVPSSHTDIKRLQEIREVELSVGDTVQVVRGELKNTVGIVREIFEDATGTKFKVQPTSDSALKEWIPFTKESLRKIVAVGQHVKIVAGAHRGEAGMVVSISKGNLVRLFASRSKCEYEVFMSDVIETQELSRGVPQYGQFEVFELVKLRGTGCGMITKFENGHFAVLTKFIDVAYVEIQAIICGTKMSATWKGRRQTALSTSSATKSCRTTSSA